MAQFARTWRHRLYPGDICLLPAGTLHAVRNVETCLSYHRMHLDRINLNRLCDSFVNGDTKPAHGISHRRILWNSAHSIIEALERNTLEEIIRKEYLADAEAIHQCVSGMRSMDGHRNSGYDWCDLMTDVSNFYIQIMEKLETTKVGSSSLSSSLSSSSLPSSSEACSVVSSVVVSSVVASAAQPPVAMSKSNKTAVTTTRKTVNVFSVPNAAVSSSSSITTTSATHSLAKLDSHLSVRGESNGESSEKKNVKQHGIVEFNSIKEMDSTDDDHSVHHSVPTSSSSFKKKSKSTQKILLDPSSGDLISIKLIGRQRKTVTVMEKVEGVQFVLVTYAQWQDHFNEYQPLGRVSFSEFFIFLSFFYQYIMFV